MTAKQTVVLAHINCSLWLCRDFIIGKDIPLRVNQVMVEKANVKVQRWVFAAVKPQTLNHNTVQCELLLHSSQCRQRLAYICFGRLQRCSQVAPALMCAVVMLVKHCKGSGGTRAVP